MNMWHVSNAGVILEINRLLIGIDIFTEENIAPYMYRDIYALNSASDRDFLSNIPLLTVTHDHSDHFSSKKTGAYLRANPQTIFWGTDKTVEALRDREQIDRARFYNETYHTPYDNKTYDQSLSLSKSETALQKPSIHSFYQQGVLVQRIPSVHMGNQALQTEHHSILIAWKDFHILINGDARPGEDFYESVKKYTDNIHVLIAPFPCLGLKSARKCLSRYFSPRKIFLIHLPDPLLDSGNWIPNAKKVCQTAQDNLPDPIFCDTLGQRYSLMESL